MFTVGSKKSEKLFGAGFQSWIIPSSFFFKLDFCGSGIIKPKETYIVVESFAFKPGYLATGLKAWIFANIVCGIQRK